jgi:hypothetical protein
MIIWGGSKYEDGYANYLNTGGRYNPLTDSWIPTSTNVNALSARSEHTAVWTGTEMIIWGGWDINVGYCSTGARFNPSMDSWIPTSTAINVPSKRYAHAAAWTGTEMIIWGGFDGKSWPNLGGRYNPSTDSWIPTNIGANVPQGRCMPSSVWTGREMIIWGGVTEVFNYLNTGGRYNPSTDSWAPTSMGTGVPSARGRHTAVWTGMEMIIWGGYDDSDDLNTGGRYDPSSDSWASISTGNNAPSAREYHTAIWTGTEMIIWGGQTSGSDWWNLLNTGGRYNPFSDSWIPISIGANVPSARAGHSAIWTGAEMIVWGGTDYHGSHFNTGGKYFPSTDSWFSTPIGASTPVGRYEHTAVWTGKEMVIWGGGTFASDGWTAFNTGGRFDPTIDLWSPTSIGSNVPLSRYFHSAVWSGMEMIVWGGIRDDGFTYLNSGGRYNPSTDSWMATSTGDNVPSMRRGNAAVWTGTEMIIWGGQLSGSAHYSNTGGRYNPLSDSWLPTSTNGYVPSGRFYPTAVWTGLEMVIWGGNSDSNPYYLNSGGRYNPLSNSWVSTSTEGNVPSGRAVATAIWTGSDMIIWGGNYYTKVLNTGALYSPKTDSWVPTSSGTGVASARSGHSAVWTGNVMIVWGGDGLCRLASGGIYRPYSSHNRPVERP